MTISSLILTGSIPITFHKLESFSPNCVTHSSPHISWNRRITNNKSRTVSLISSRQKVSQACNSRAIKESLATFSSISDEIFFFSVYFCSPKMAQNNKSWEEKKNYNIIKCFHAKQIIHHSTVLVSSLLLLPRNSKTFSIVSSRR